MLQSTNASLFGNLVSTVDKKVYRHSKMESLYNVPIVDYTSVFFHFIVSLQVAIAKDSVVRNQLYDLYNSLEVYSKFLLDNINTVNSSWPSAASIRLSEEKEQLQIALTDQLKFNEVAKIAMKLQSQVFYANESHSSLLSKNLMQSEIFLSKSTFLSSVRSKRLNELLAIFGNAENERIATESLKIENELNSSLTSFIREATELTELIRFRISEESRLSKDNENIRLRIVEAKAEASRLGFELIVRSLVTEVIDRYHLLASNPVDCAKYIMFVLFIFVLAILVFEFGITLKSFVTDYYGLRSAHSSSMRMRFAKDQVLFFEDEIQGKFQYFSNLVRHASKYGGPLPMMIKSGENGCGKTEAAEYLGLKCNIPTVTVNASDLKAKDPKFASMYLKRIMKGSKKYGICSDDWNVSKPILVVMDEADDFIVERSFKSGRSVSNVSMACFYNILEAARSSSSEVAIILCTKIALNDIDRAILNRYMHSVLFITV